MLIIFLKIIVASLIISICSWLASKQSALAGFITALPLTTMIALLFSQIEWKDSDQSVEYAKNILYAVPFSLLFFVPFLLAKKFQLSFWSCYFSGTLLLLIGFLIHSGLTKNS